MNSNSQVTMNQAGGDMASVGRQLDMLVQQMASMQKQLDMALQENRELKEELARMHQQRKRPVSHDPYGANWEKRPALEEDFMGADEDEVGVVMNV
jgi:regulator of replication initiation timing